MGREQSIADWLGQMQDRYLTGDYTGALELAERILAEDAGHPSALRHAERCRNVLSAMLLSRLGPSEQRVERNPSGAGLRWITLDPEAETLLALAEQRPSIEELVERSGLPRLSALRRLWRLIEQRVLVLRDPS